MSDSKGLGQRAFHVPTPQVCAAKTCKCEGVMNVQWRTWLHTTWSVNRLSLLEQVGNASG